MSDTSQGEGWWQASDLKWYPPETHPSYRPLPPPPPAPVIPPPPPPTPPAPVSSQYPPPPTDEVAKRRQLAGYLVAGGAVLLIVGSFLPWAKLTAPFIGSIGRTGIDAGDGWISAVIGSLLAVVAWRFFLAAKAGTRAPIVLALLLSLAGLGLTVYEWVDIENAANDVTEELQSEEDFPPDLGFGSLFNVQQGAGLYVVGLGALAGVGALAYKQPPKDG